MGKESTHGRELDKRPVCYLPLGGNRVSTPRWVVNLLVVWGLTGLWHGASWNFVLWGTYYGVLLIGEKLLWGSLLPRLPRLLRHLYASAAFLLGWVFFRIDDFSTMAGWFSALFGAYGPGDLSLLQTLGVLHLWPWFLIAPLASTPGPDRIVAALGRRPLGRCCTGLLDRSHTPLVRDRAGNRRIQPVHLFPFLERAFTAASVP